jgi:hypothetical protein
MKMKRPTPAERKKEAQIKIAQLQKEIDSYITKSSKLI